MRSRVFAFVLACSMPAFAADPPTDPAAAETLFDEGRKLMDSGKLPEACAKFEASHRMDPAVGTLLNLGDCNEQRKRFASAWSNYRAAESLALTRKDSNRAEFARKKGAAIKDKISMLTIEVAQPEPGLKVTRDGVLVDEAAWGSAVPIDPGAHTIEASAPGKKSVTLKITVTEGTPSQSSVKVEPLLALASTPVGPLPPVPPKKDDTNREPFLTTGRIVGLGAIGVGVVALGIGSVFAIQAKSTWNEQIDTGRCDSFTNQCDEEGLVGNQDARDKGTVATVFIITGLVAAAAGAAALLFWPKPAPPRPQGVHWHGAGFVF